MTSHGVIKKILKDTGSKKLTPRKAFVKLKNLSYESLGFANVDHHRTLRKGFPEVIYAPGKTLAQLKLITRTVLKSKQPLLITRIDQENFEKLKKDFPELQYSEHGRIAHSAPGKNGKYHKESVAVVTAGTSDIPVAEEAGITLEMMGIPVSRIYDCGVAGLHRLLDRISDIQKANLVICVAGMEGALPSVLAGLIDKPVIAVPTSVGYGANFKGLSALLAMLNSCAQGVSVVNIDNGFGAACFATLCIARGRF